MPKIEINERDFTGNRTYNPNECIVYIAGMPGNDKKSNFENFGQPILCKSLSQFTSIFGKQAYTEPGTGTTVVYDKAFISAHRLLELGLYVLYEVPSKTVGSTTSAVSTISELTTAIKTNSFYDKLKDRNKYNIRFIYSAGYIDTDDTEDTTSDNVTTPSVVKYISSIVATRGDCVYLVDCPDDVTNAEEIMTEFMKVSTAASVNDKYLAGFAPHCTFNIGIEKIYQDHVLPGSFAYLEALANSIVYYPQWYAVAGTVRGQIPDIVKTNINLGEQDIELLQKRTVNTIAVNPIAEINPYGIVVFGNRTLYKNVSTDVTSTEDGLKASSFLNIRQLTNILKKTVYRVCRTTQFEQNDDILWVKFKSSITPILEQMVGTGIKGYRFYRVNSENLAELRAKIRIIPIEPVEDFYIDIELADSLEVVTEE